MKKLIPVWLIFLFLPLMKPVNAQIIRGADTAEIYLHCFWYAANMHYYYCVLRSVNNGQEFSVRYFYDNHCSEPIPALLGDSMPGVIYFNYVASDSLKISMDSGTSFDKITIQPKHEMMVSGCTGGELYFNSYDPTNPGLFRVTGFGNTSTLINNNFSLHGLNDLGTLPGEVYATLWPYIWDTIGLSYSRDFGCTFSTTYIDTNLITGLGGTRISRGTEPGEFYLIRCDLDYRYYIFHTFDYGQTLELKHITQPYMHPSEWLGMHEYTAGRTPGSFYRAYCTIDSGAFLGPHTKIWLYYSSDYGETYTVYFHDLDSTYTGIKAGSSSATGFYVFPNPASDKLTVEFPENKDGVLIELFDITGRMQRCAQVPPDQRIYLEDVSTMKPGVYFMKVSEGRKMIWTKKVIVNKWQ